MTMITARNMKFGKDLPNMNIALSSYENPITLVNGTTDNPYYKTFIDIVSKDSILKDFGGEDLSTNALTEVIKCKRLSRHLNQNL